jgi:hypothetical protein
VKARPTFPGLANALSDLAPTDDTPLAEAPTRPLPDAPASCDGPAMAELRKARRAAPATRPSQRLPVPLPSAEQRLHTRFDKAFLVVVGSELYGDTHAIARNISAGGVLVEMCYAPPLGSVMTVHFRHVRDDGHVDEIVARAEVKHHHYLNFTGGNESDSARAVGLRFLEFIDPSDEAEGAASRRDHDGASFLH